MAVRPLDVLQCTAKMSQAGQTILNIYEVIHAGSVDVADVDALAAVRSWLEAAYAYINGDLSPALTYTSISVVNVTQDTIVGEGTWPGLTAGSDPTADAEPLQVAAVVRFPSNYRGSQGRKFIGGLTEARVGSNGVLTSGTVLDLTNYGGVLLVGFSVGTEPFIYGANNVAKSRFADFQSVIVNSVVGTQRRRRQGYGI